MNQGKGFTMPPTYCCQDFDEKQTRADELTAEDRAAGRPAPAHGYSAENYAKAEAEYKEALRQFWG